ncbi:PAS domain-containing protein [Candidatus Saccharibacteria bacterium]|nr:PAS domain-containing protein [Candidatus Saccharibacteria bacterium]
MVEKKSKKLPKMSAKQVEDAKIEHQRLESLINSMSDGVIAVDENAAIALYNAAALDVLDVNAIQKGDPVEKVLKLTNEQNDPLDTRNIVLGAKTQVISRDYKIKYNDESIISIYLSISPVHLGYGKTGDRGFVLIIRDITREKSLEEERDEFISVISHELRTPVAITEGAVSNALFIADKTGDMDKIKEALDNAHKQAKYLEDMINDLSTLSRAERGVLEENLEDINAHEFAESLQSLYIKDAEAKGLKLHLDIDPTLEIFHSSKLYVQEIMQNFITNAIKYTETGSVTVGAKKRKGGVEFSVTDTGIGISKGDQARVFDKFFRAEDYRTRQQNGTGLGLHVTRKLAQLAHAEISLESELNKGSTFTIYFPNLK